MTFTEWPWPRPLPNDLVSYHCLWKLVCQIVLLTCMNPFLSYAPRYRSHGQTAIMLQGLANFALSLTLVARTTFLVTVQRLQNLKEPISAGLMKQLPQEIQLYSIWKGSTHPCMLPSVFSFPCQGQISPESNHVYSTPWYIFLPIHIDFWSVIYQLLHGQTRIVNHPVSYTHLTLPTIYSV